MGAMILAEVGDFSRFDSPDKLLAYAGMPPSTYQSGQLKNCYSHMEKRGSRYLRYALYNEIHCSDIGLIGGNIPQQDEESPQQEITA